MKERIAIIDGIRTPFAKAGTSLKNVPAQELGAFIFKELLERTGFPQDQIDELILGNVGQPSGAANIARVVALKGGLDKKYQPILSIKTVHQAWNQLRPLQTKS